MIAAFENAHGMYCTDREMKVQVIRNGIILPQKKVENGPMWGLGGVCDAERRFVALSAYDGGWATHGGAYAWEKEDYMDCDVVYFGMFFNHWGHFLIDLMGRLWYYVKNAGCNLKLAYLGEETPRGNFLEIFDLLGISAENLIRITEPTRFRTVIVPEFSCKSCEWYGAEYRHIFDAMIDRVAAERYAPEHLQPLKKVYFSRLAFGKAKATEFGEEAIAKWLESNGFSAVGPETLSVRDQIYLWNHAKEIVCLDGSIPMSIAFSANPKLRLTILRKSSLEHLNVELYLLMRPCEVTFLDVWDEPFKGYPKNIGAGPFLFHLGEDAKRYSEQREWKFPFSDAELKKRLYRNRIRLAWCILDWKGKARRLLSRILPQKVKNGIRRLLHG